MSIKPGKMNDIPYGVDLDVPEQRMVLAAFSGDGGSVITLHGAHDIFVWDTYSGERKLAMGFPSKLPGRPKGHRLYVESVRLNHDGREALIGFNDGTAGLFDVATGDRLLSVELPDSIPEAERYGNVRAVNFSSDESLLLVGFHNRKVGIFDRVSNRLTHFYHFPNPLVDYSYRLSGPLGANARHISITEDNRYLFVAYIDLGVVIWDVENNRYARNLYEHGQEFQDIALDHNSVTAITFSGYIWRVVDGNLDYWMQTIPPTFDWTRLSSDGESFIGGREDEIVQGWVSSGNVQTLESYDNDDFEPLLFAGDNSETYFYQPSKNQLALSVEGRKAVITTDQRIRGCLLSPDKSLLVVRLNHSVKLWNVEQEDFVESLTFEGWIKGVCFSNAGDFLAIQSNVEDSNRFSIFSSSDYDLKYELVSPKWWHTVVFLSDDSAIAALDGDGNVALWKLGTNPILSEPEAQATFKPGFGSKLFALPEQRLAIQYGEKLEIWHRLDTKLYEFAIKWTDRMSHWKLSQDGRILAVMSDYQIVKCWDVMEGKYLGEFGPDIPRPRFINDDPVFAEIKPGITLYGWQYDDLVFIHNTPPITRAAFLSQLSPDGSLIAVPCEGGLAVITTYEPHKVVAVVDPGGVREFLDASPPHKVLLRLPFQDNVITTFVTDDTLFAIEKHGKVLAYPYRELLQD